MSRHAIDRIEFLAVEGWALTSDGQPADVGLWCDAELAPAELSRLPRPDVQAYFDGTVALDCGFELRLDTSSWWRRFGTKPIRCTLHVGGEPTAELEVMLDEAEFVAWIDAVVSAPASSWRTAEWARLQPLLAPDAMGRGDLPHWAQCGWQQGGSAPLSLRAAVERIEDFQVIGWIDDTVAPNDNFVVHCHRQSWRVRARRVERDDVRRAMADIGLRCGFEIELPSEIWTATPASADAWIQVSVNGHRLTPRPRRLARAALQPALLAALQWWGDRAVAERPAIASDAWLKAADQGFRQALALEHALAAGLLSQLSADAQARLRRHLTESDARALSLWMDREPNRFAASAGPNDDARAVWCLQQSFNRAVGEAIAAGMEGAASLRQSLDRVLAENVGQASEQLQTFLSSLVPTFCSMDALSALRPLLDGSHLDFLERHDGRWELSLLLPLRLRDELPTGRLSVSVALMQRIARPGAGGWLNTATVSDAITQVHQTLQAGALLDDVEVHQFVGALLSLWQSLAADSPWSRMHDQCLVQGHVTLLRCQEWLDEPLFEQVVRSALRHYALTPAFWRAARQSLLAAEWPATLLAFQARVEPVLAALTGDAVDRHVAELHGLLAWARADGYDEAAFLQRHVLLASVDPDGWLAGLPDADQLRVSLWGGLADAAWRQVCPVPWPSQVATRAAAWAARRELGHAVIAQDPDRRRAALIRLRAASGERSGFIGLPLLLQSALEAASGGAVVPDETGEALIESLEFALDACVRRQAAAALPPAALCAVGLGLAYWSSQPEAPEWVHALGQRWTEAAMAMWGAQRASWAAASPAGPVDLRSSQPGIGVLIVLRRKAGVGRPLAAHSPWIDALREGGFGPGQGFDLCWWDPACNADHVGEMPRLTPPSLLGLLRHLFEHSDYGHFLLIDAETEPAFERWLARTGVMTAHYHGVADPEPTGQVLCEPQRVQFDLSAVDVPAARVTTGLGLSRQALGRALALFDDDGTPLWLTRVTDEERLLANLLAAAGVTLDQHGHWLFEAHPGPGFLDAPPPGPAAETVMTIGQLDGPVAANLAGLPGARGPARIWPADRAPSLVGAQGSQQLVRLKDPWAGTAAPIDEVGVFAVARNERVLMPHFLAHYRALGVRRFTIADNLSDDGTREYLLDQPDVMLYSVDTPYKLSHYGVAWQQAMLAAHAQGRWALVVDIDEFLVWPGCETETLIARCNRLATDGHDAALALMVDMYPEGPLDAADFERGAPFNEAPCFDAVPALHWRLGSGSYSNSASYVSSARHRVLPGSPPNHYTAQKVPLLRYHPFVRWSEGLHYAAGVQRAPEPLFLAHFKYHRGFRLKVEEEVARKQHYNDAEEYRKYRALWAEARGIMFDPAVSRRYIDSQSFADIPWN